VKALSVRQPWASLIGDGVKTIELRTWYTRHRGPLAIVAAVTLSREGCARFGRGGPRGVVVCVVELLNVRRWRDGDELRALSHGKGWYSWELRVSYKTQLVPTRGRLSLYEIPTPPPAS
jgi:hypothetical protein